MITRRRTAPTAAARRIAVGAALLMTLLAQPASSVRVMGTSTDSDRGSSSEAAISSGSGGPRRRPYLRPAAAGAPSRQMLIEESEPPAVLASPNATAAPVESPAARSFEYLRMIFTSASSSLPSSSSSSSSSSPEAAEGAAKASRLPPQLQNPKASPLPLPPEVQNPKASPLPVPPMGGDEEGVDESLFFSGGDRSLQPAPVCGPAFTWTADGGELRVNGQPFHLKGANWFGFETSQRVPFGLDEHDMDFYFQFLADNRFNAIRLPISVDFALDPDGAPDAEADENLVDARLKGVNNFVRLSTFIDTAAEHGILVMLDMHRLDPAAEITPLWYDDSHTFDDYLQAWDNTLTIFGGKWNVFAIDLKNEPHGVATWAAGQPSTDWNSAAEAIGDHVAKKHPQFTGLIFVEGIDHPTTTANKQPINQQTKPWGGDLEGVLARPITLKTKQANSRIVYSPHVYGPSVYDRDYFKGKDFPGNMPAIWKAQWAFVQEATQQAVVLGEWGGKNEVDGPVKDRDRVWHQALADFLVENCMSSQMYWCLNPNSGDTNGLLLADWTSPDQDKLDLLARVQPDPSVVSRSGDQYCVVSGSYANAACAK